MPLAGSFNDVPGPTAACDLATITITDELAAAARCSSASPTSGDPIGVSGRTRSIGSSSSAVAICGHPFADLDLAPQVSNHREKAPRLLEGLSALGSWFAGIESRESFRHTSYAA